MGRYSVLLEDQVPKQDQPDLSPVSVKKVSQTTRNAPKKAATQFKQQLSTQAEKSKMEKKEINIVTMQPRYHDTTQPIYQDSLIEAIRKAVKQLGKEAATYRFTAEEKRSLADIVYSYKAGGVRTSENEITRTAINFLLEDYRENGSNSVLAKVIARLNE